MFLSEGWGDVHDIEPSKMDGYGGRLAAPDFLIGVIWLVDLS